MSVHPRTDGNPGYYVRYRDPSGRQREAWGPSPGQRFRRKADAEAYEAAIKTDLRRGQWRDPDSERLRVAELGERWLTTKRDPNTVAWNTNMLRHVNTRWARVPIGAVDFLDVQAWVNDLERNGMGPDTVRGAYRVLHEIVKAAQRIRAIHYDPCDGVSLPRIVRREMLFLTPEQVDALAMTLDDDWPDAGWGSLVRFAAYSGCRAGEIGGLQAKHLDLTRRRVNITQSLKTYGEIGTTKTDRARWVDLPRQLCDLLGEHLEVRCLGPNDLIWTGDRGGPLNHKWFYNHRYKPTVLAMREIPDALRFHDLRHTCVAFLIAQGAQQYEVMEHLGHSKIQTTIDTYGHLFPSVRQRIREALETTWVSVPDTTRSQHPREQTRSRSRSLDGGWSVGC